MNTQTVLVLDGETRSALAVTRALGKAGYIVFVASTDSKSLSGSSKFCSCTLRNPCIKNARFEFKEWLLRILKEVKPTYLLPCSDLTLTEVINLEEEVSTYTNLPFAKKLSINKTQDKFEILKAAELFGINCPRTMLITKENSDNLDFSQKLIDEIGLPIVFKARVSIQNTANNTTAKPPICYAHSKIEVENFLNSKLPNEFQYIAQSYIMGEGRGIFLSFKDNKNVATFAHKRVLEKPPEGGVSVLSESIKVDPVLVKQCEELLNSLSWNGVAMIEFKYTQDKKYFLMEINPRFWGSLQLAIDSGVNFPVILLAEEGNKEIGDYRVGHRLRWELGILDHFLIQFKRNGFSFLKNVLLGNCLEFFRNPTQNEIFRLSDNGPFKFEIKSYLKQLTHKH